jgi:hypothetical protein
MSYKHFLSFLLILVFSSLVACGSSDSKSSRDKATVKACPTGDSPLKNKESCKISDNVYTCKSGRLIGPKLNVRGKYPIGNSTLFCE